MAAAVQSYELQSLTSDTPLLYQGILLEESFSEEPEKTHKASVLIEAPTLIPTPKDVSEQSTKWTLKCGLMHCSDLSISDEWGHAEYEVKTNGFWHIDMNFLDVNTGLTVSQLKQRFALMTSFDLYMRGSEHRTANIRHRMSFGLKISVVFDNGEPEITVKGNHCGTRYSIYRGDVVIANVVRKWKRHEYEIAAGEDKLLMHSLIAASDKILAISRRKGGVMPGN